MKCMVILVFFLSCFRVSAQPSKDFKYTYEIQPDYDLERNIAEVMHHPGNHTNNLYVVVENLKEEPLKFASVELSNSDTVIKVLTNENGEINTHLPLGKYTLSTSTIGYKRFTFPVQTVAHHQVQCFFQLGRSKLKYYTIRSRKKLNETELNTIENCIESHSSFESCNQPNLYTIELSAN